MNLETLNKAQLIAQIHSLRKELCNNLNSSKKTDFESLDLVCDISELNRERERLLEEKSFLKKIKRLARLGSWQWNVDRDELVLSEDLYDMFGIGEAQRNVYSFMDLLNLVHHSDRKQFRSSILQAIADPAIREFSFGMRILKPNGHSKNFSCSASINRGKDIASKVTVACLDATDAFVKEKALQESEEKFRLLAEESPARIFKINKKLRIEYINKLALSDLAPQSKIPTSIHPFFSKTSLPILVDAIYEVFEESESRHIEYLDEEGDKEKWFSLSITPIKENDNVVSALLLSYDISEKKRGEQTLKDINEELEKKVKKRTEALEKAKTDLEIAYQKEKELGSLKSQFVSTASHQFRTPLTVIQSNVGLLEMLIKESLPSFQKQFERINLRIQAEIRRMTDLMDNVLILGRKEAGTLKVELQPIDINKEVESIVNKYNQIQQDGREARIELSGTPKTLDMDRELFENAFSNLVSNAFKYSKDKPAPLITLAFEKEQTCIGVQDFGIGIPPADLEHIFEPFYRASNVSSINGTGLGTAIAKTYFELMGHTLKIESTVNEGTRFTILIENTHE